MSVSVDPFVIPIPRKWADDPELAPTIQYVWRYLYDLRERTGGDDDAVAALEDSALYDVGIKGAEIAEIIKQIEELRIQLAFLDTQPSEETAAVSGSSYGNSIEHDFGSTPVYDASFTITDAQISGTSTVLVTPGGAATGRTADDWQWDGASIGVVPGAGTATCYVTFSPGPVVGRRKFNYTVI